MENIKENIIQSLEFSRQARASEEKIKEIERIRQKISEELSTYERYSAGFFEVKPSTEVTQFPKTGNTVKRPIKAIIPETFLNLEAENPHTGQNKR